MKLNEEKCHVMIFCEIHDDIRVNIATYFYDQRDQGGKDKIHEHIQELLLLGRRTKGNFACCFRSFLQVFERSFLQKISYFHEKE